MFGIDTVIGTAVDGGRSHPYTRTLLAAVPEMAPPALA